MAHTVARGVKISVAGIVQGVGFRPFVYTLARRLGLVGSVVNSGRGVEICLCDAGPQVSRFLELLRSEAPALARISAIEVTAAEVEAVTSFVIGASSMEEGATTMVPPDIATCDDCLADIFTPGNRRYHYPFTNCTNCGPRLTIIRQLPYDRVRTSMAAFTMCPECSREYHDPGDRRFHAQPNACPACGPRLAWHDRQGRALGADSEALASCARALARGHIVAIKGLGGFQLAVDAASERAVRLLRQRKNRPAKPLAVMVPDLERASGIARISDQEQELLVSPGRPIVLLRRRPSPLPDLLAPSTDELGIMLPCTPLHHLLFAMDQCPPVLVMTSGNAGGEPICTDNREAFCRLAGIADFFLVHDRDILTRVDDSVARVVRSRLQMIRRARGYVPMPLGVRQVDRHLLACGAEQKNTFCLARDGQVFPGQHIGDLKGPDNMVFFEESVRLLEQVLDVRPERVACDLHPDYLSSRFGAGLGLPLVRVQHHHAHGAAIMAEHGLAAGLAVVFDGAGLGPDRTVWGGEFLRLQGHRYERCGRLARFRLPGGDQAAVQTWRAGLSLLAAAGVDITRQDLLPPGLQTLPPSLRKAIATMLGRGINSPLCSSVGRLFDGVAALIGIRQEVSFEGQAAMELENLARRAAGSRQEREYPVLVRQEELPVLDFGPMVRSLLEDIRRETEPALMAAAFHAWLTASVIAVLETLEGAGNRIENVLLGGGCFQNRLLLAGLARRLEEKGLAVYSGEQVPVNDGGIALGQVLAAAGEEPAGEWCLRAGEAAAGGRS